MAVDPPADRSSNLPVPLTPLVGREREVAAVADLLRQDGTRLVTLTGPGGVGKTRLALDAARQVADGFPDGVAFVGLSPISDPALVAPSIAQAFGVREAGGEPLDARLGAFLHDRLLLLVLDNFEQVVEAAPLVADLLGSCPGLAVLATSREPLKVGGEHEYLVPPLALPPTDEPPSAERLGQSGAVRLFAERAYAAAPDFALTPEHAPIVAEICRRVDGLPLAIELAAARVKTLPLPALLARLDPRLPLLAGARRDVPQRQRTMRDTIAWSHDLLSRDEQTLFRRLAVFAGGFRLEAAEAVAEAAGGLGVEVFDGVCSLADKSLLRQEAGADGEPRYAMLETVREFGLERLAAAGEEDATRHLHAAWCLVLAERSGEVVAGMSEDPRWVRRAETEHDNLRAALGWLEGAGSGEGVLRLAVALQPLWIVRGARGEAIAWLELGLARSPGAPVEVRVRALRWLGFNLERRGHFDRARPLLGQALTLARELGDPLETARALAMLGRVATNLEQYDQATALLEEALAGFRRQGDEDWMCDVRYLLGIVAYGRAAFAEAVIHLDAVLAWRRADAHPIILAVVLNALALVRCELGEEASAATLLAESGSHLRPFGNDEVLAEWLAAVARLAVSRGRLAPAARLYGAAEGLTDGAGVPLVVPPRSRHRRHVDALRDALGPDAFAAAWAAGRALSPEQALAEARAVTAEPAAEDESPSPAPPGRGQLTPREEEVLRLLVAGRTNPEIAAALYVSPRTAETHVTHILAKLGVASRAEAAARAVRDGLA